VHGSTFFSQLAKFLPSRRHTATGKQPFIYSSVIKTRIVAVNQYAVSLLDPGYNRIVIGDQITGKIPAGDGAFTKGRLAISIGMMPH